MSSPKLEDSMEYRCLGCQKTYSIDSLLYICPDCGGVLLIHDLDEKKKRKRSGKLWQTDF